MKRKDLIKLFEASGWYMLRHGSGHDIYTDGEQLEALPRHKEINEMLAKKIIKLIKKSIKERN